MRVRASSIRHHGYTVCLHLKRRSKFDLAVDLDLGLLRARLKSVSTFDIPFERFRCAQTYLSSPLPCVSLFLRSSPHLFGEFCDVKPCCPGFYRKL